MTKHPFGNFNVIKQCDMQFLEKNIKIVSFKHILIAKQALFSAVGLKTLLVFKEKVHSNSSK